MRCWILIADATRARIFSTTGPHDPLQLVQETVHPRGRARPQELMSDEAGRLQKAGGDIKSAMDPHTDPHDAELHRFAHELGLVLQAGRARGDYDGLGIVAPPRFLGLLRETLGHQVEKAVRACVTRDCSRIETRDLPEHIRDAVLACFGLSAEGTAPPAGPESTAAPAGR